MKSRHKRLGFILFALIGVSISGFLVMKAFKKNLVFFYTPTQIVEGEAPLNTNFRIGGLVKPGSLVRSGTNLEVHFVVTDNVNDASVVFTGILPDLFKEGKGVVAEGVIDKSGAFVAKNVLAKHDENYMPPEAAEALKRAQNKKAR
jgi:cytochrome c-type biogenesis protein CcmE